MLSRLTPRLAPVSFLVVSSFIRVPLASAVGAHACALFRIPRWERREKVCKGTPLGPRQGVPPAPPPRRRRTGGQGDTPWTPAGAAPLAPCLWHAGLALACVRSQHTPLGEWRKAGKG